MLIHPHTDEEFVLHAIAERMVVGDDGAFAGVQARFAPLPAEERTGLAQFCAQRLDSPATGYGLGPKVAKK